MKADSILIVVHSGLGTKITQNDVMSALPKDASIKKKYVEVQVGESKLSELYELNFEQYALEQTRIYQKEIEPWLKENSNSIIAYFGLVPIALAIHLGYLLGNFNRYWIFQHHHKYKKWYRDIDEKDSFGIKVSNLPVQPERGKGNILLRLSASYLVDENQSLSVLSDPMKEIDLKLHNLGIDTFKKQSQIDEVAERFQEILGNISNFLPNSDSIHLFASIPCGLSFLLGTKINPNATPKIVMYQFSKDEKPPYKQALVISKQIGEEVALTNEEINLADQIRREWAKSLEDKIQPFIENVVLGSNDQQWFSILGDVNGETGLIINNSHFANLPSLALLSLKSDSISILENVVEGDFNYDKASSSWYFDDRLLVTISKRASKKNFDLKRAGRLFLFHESLHYSDLAHNLVQENAIGIGRFPKVIEEADYQADVYAILNDWKYSSVFHKSEVKSTKEYYLKAIETAVETMWSFIDTGENVVEFQIRTMNRLLNWYWQYVMIENSRGTLLDIIEILINKPIIEIAGLDMKLRGHRTYYILNENTAANWQMAAFYNNKVFRFTPNNMGLMVKGFKELNGESIIKGMRSFISNL